VIIFFDALTKNYTKIFISGWNCAIVSRERNIDRTHWIPWKISEH